MIDKLDSESQKYPGRVADKLNELIDAYNKLEADYATHYHTTLYGARESSYPRDDTRGHG